MVISLGGDYNYARTCSLRFMYVLHVGGCGLDLPKVELVSQNQTLTHGEKVW